MDRAKHDSTKEAIDRQIAELEHEIRVAENDRDTADLEATSVASDETQYGKALRAIEKLDDRLAILRDRVRRLILRRDDIDYQGREAQIASALDKLNAIRREQREFAESKDSTIAAEHERHRQALQNFEDRRRALDADSNAEHELHRRALDDIESRCECLAKSESELSAAVVRMQSDAIKVKMYDPNCTDRAALKAQLHSIQNPGSDGTPEDSPRRPQITVRSQSTK